jgi:cytochrome c oxidase subunit 1
VRRYLFTTDHKIVGLQYLWLSLIAAIIGIALSALMRFHLTKPAAQIPLLGTMKPETYLSVMTMHGSLMVFFVLSVAPQSAFGAYFLPLQIGARQMTHPLLSAISFWLTAVAFLAMLAAFFVPGGAPLAGWTAYPPLSAVGASSGPGEGAGQTLWILSIAIFSAAAVLSAISFIATTLDGRAPGIRLRDLPLTCWNWFVTAILSLLGFPVLLAACVLLLLDRVAGTSFFVPGGLVVSERAIAHAGGSPLLWQHLFWFFGHPEVYIAILPGMGLISEVISTFSHRPIFGRRAMIISTFAIAFLGLLVWGHHMFTSGMSPYSSIAFSALSMTIAVPSAVKTFNWLGTLWGGRIELTTAMLFALGFVSVFVAGGLSGIFLAQPALDLYLHDTYFVVAHFHLVMGVAAIFGVFSAIFYWAPRMFGRMLDERLGKIHFFATLAGVYAIFVPMHLAGIAGNPRRYADFTSFDFLAPLAPLHAWMTLAAVFTAAVQIIFFVNLLWSIRRGALAPANPWSAQTREWDSTTPLAETTRTASTGVGALLAAITMLFSALSSAYIVRRGLSTGWTPLSIAPVLAWSSAALLTLSAGALAWRQKSILPPLLGAAAAALIVVLWMRGAAASGTELGFLNVFLGAFLACLLSGLAVLILRRESRNIAIYWRYLAGMWIWLVLLFRVWS